MKVCKKCSIEKKLEEFTKTISNDKVYYRGECKICFRIKNNKSQRQSKLLKIKDKKIKDKKIRPTKYNVKPKAELLDINKLERDRCFKWIEMINGRSGWIDIKGLLIDLMEVYETLIGSVTYVEGKPHDQLTKMWFKVNQEYDKNKSLQDNSIRNEELINYIKMLQDNTLAEDKKLLQQDIINLIEKNI
jgi:hypothetical protein